MALALTVVGTVKLRRTVDDAVVVIFIRLCVVLAPELVPLVDVLSNGPLELLDDLVVELF